MSRVVEVESVTYEGGTVAVIFGRDVQTGQGVTFGADWRPARDLNEALSGDGDGDGAVLAEIEDWQILGVSDRG